MLVGLGVVLRVVLVVQWHPAFVGYSDSGVYFQGAYEDIWSDPIRTVGYAVVLDVLHALTPHLLLPIVIQHLLGLTTAVLLFLTVRRTAAPAWLALLPAATILLSGPQVFLEHAALSEGFFTPLLALGLLAAVRAPAGRVWWAVLAGLCVGLCITLKGVGVVLVPVLGLALLFHAGPPGRRPALLAGLATACALLVVGAYVGLRQQQTNLEGLTTNGNWNFYGRVAPWADCTKFTPPAGTRQLCEAEPPTARGGRVGEFYIFDNRSPGIRYAGPAYRVSPVPGAMDAFGRFSKAAILGQPAAYLAAVWDDEVRLVDIDHPSYGQASPDQLRGQFLAGLQDGTPTGNAFVESWRALEYPADDPLAGHHDMAALTRYDRWTTPRGPLMLLVLVLAAVAPLAAPRGARAVASLTAATAWVLLAFPIVSKGYDFRFVVPTLGPLVAAAALGGWGIAERLGIWLRRRA